MEKPLTIDEMVENVLVALSVRRRDRPDITYRLTSLEARRAMFAVYEVLSEDNVLPLNFKLAVPVYGRTSMLTSAFAKCGYLYSAWSEGEKSLTLTDIEADAALVAVRVGTPELWIACADLFIAMYSAEINNWHLSVA